MRFHELRHANATIALLKGVLVHVVSKRLGHADPSMTYRVYAHVIPQQGQEAAELIAAAIGL